LVSEWLKETFGEKDKSYGESRQGGSKSKERINIRVTIKKQDSVVTSAKFVGESTHATLEDVKYNIGPDTICPPTKSPQVKEPHSNDIGTSLGSPSPSA
jgi:hypothetical protein